MAARKPPPRLVVGCAALLLANAQLAGKPIASQGAPAPLPLVVPAVTRESPADDSDDAPVGEPQYDTMLAPLPANVPGIGFEATGTSELGDLVRLAERVHYPDSVTITLSSWAIRSDFPGSPPLGFMHPITLRLYRVDRSGGFARAGDPIATLTQPFLIPWRPEPDPTSTSPLRPWRAADGNHYTGRAFTVTFDLGALGLSLPDEVIYGISFNTQHHGPAALGVPGPYDYLHVGLNVEAPRSGADLDPDAVFWKTAHAGEYADGGAAGVNIFRRDTAWTPYRPAVRFNNSPYGALAAVTSRLGGLPAGDARMAAILERGYTLASWALERRLWLGNNRLQPLTGRLVFDLLAEAVDELAAALGSASNAEPTAPAPVAAAIAGLLRVTRSLAEAAAGDALLAGDAAPFANAELALERALHEETNARYGKAVDELGNAWRAVHGNQP